MVNEIKYIAFFDDKNSDIKRNIIPSSLDKINSIIELLNRIGVKVHIISMSCVQEPKLRFYSGSDNGIANGNRLKLFFSWGSDKKIIRRFRIVWHVVSMFTYLLSHTKRNEPILVYHSQGYWGIISLAKKIKGFKLILEVEEIYQDVKKSKIKILDKLEYYDINSADAFIFPSKVLNNIINHENKPYAIIHGRYTESNNVADKFSDGKIHVIYAGTFDPDKGGAIAAIESAEFLPSNYHIHVCGFGSEGDIKMVKNKIHDISVKSKAIVTYDGLKKGEDYTKFIQQCHIGLSTQNPAGEFNNTSFPSKILSYMSNGLSVVSIDIPVVRSSTVEKYITFYKEHTPRQISEAIMRAPLNIEYKDCFKELSHSFTESFTRMLKKKP